MMVEKVWGKAWEKKAKKREELAVENDHVIFFIGKIFPKVDYFRIYYWTDYICTKLPTYTIAQ